jgi:hypothetical protein
MILKIFSDKLTSSKIAKVIQVATDLKINPNWLLGVMYFETAKTLSPSKTNGIGSVGLIQFTRDVAGYQSKIINGKKYFLADIGKMTFEVQMDLVHEYYKEHYKRLKVDTLNSFIDVYLITFFPLAVGKPDTFVFQTKRLKASKIASQNPIFDKNKDNIITKIEVVNHFAGWYKENFKELVVSVAVGSSSFKDMISKYYKKIGWIVLPLLVFFYTIVTVIL